MREYKGLTAKRSQIIAQGFSPGISPPQECALNGRPIGTERNKSTDADTKNGRDWREVEASSLQPNAASPSGATFRAHLFETSYPGLKPWAESCCPFGADGSSQNEMSRLILGRNIGATEREKLLRSQGQNYY